MGRGKGKGQKHSAATPLENTGSGEEEKILVRRRGRPQKAVNDDIEDEEVEWLENGDVKMKGLVSNTDESEYTGKKRKKPSQMEENMDSIKVENGVGAKVNSNKHIKSVGFTQNGSRRRNKPRCVAEVGVGCECS